MGNLKEEVLCESAIGIKKKKKTIGKFMKLDNGFDIGIGPLEFMALCWLCTPSFNVNILLTSIIWEYWIRTYAVWNVAKVPIIIHKTSSFYTVFVNRVLKWSVARWNKLIESWTKVEFSNI